MDESDDENEWKKNRRRSFGPLTCDDFGSNSISEEYVCVRCAYLCVWM